MKRILFLTMAVWLLCSSAAWAQEKMAVQVSVTDTKGEPLPGATIVEVGTRNSATADVNGKTTINVAANAVLEVSFLGYTTQQVTATGTTIDVQLEDGGILLNEVVMVGYGAVKKANLTGSVDQVSSKVLENRPITSVTQALQGTIGNLNISSSTSGADRGGAPGAGMSFNIRGLAALSHDGSNPTVVNASPLIVIDGVQGGSLTNVNPDDIANISVLKDAASAAIYGSSAPYGVILVTTKQGARGRKPVVSYSGNTSWATPIHLPEMMNSLEFFDFWEEVHKNAGVGSVFVNPAALRQRIIDYQAGKITTPTIPSQWGDNWGGYEEGNDNIDWYQVYFKKWAFSQQHNLSVQGGSDNSSYYIGAGYMHKGGQYNYGNDSYNRYSVRANLSSNVYKWLTANLRTSFTRGLYDTPNNYGGKTGDANSQGWMHNLARKWPNVPLKNNDGYYSDPGEVSIFEYGGRNNFKNDNVAVVGELVFEPIKGWQTTVNYSLNSTYYDDQYNPIPVMRVNPSGGESVIPNTDTAPLSRQMTTREYYVLNAFTSYEWEQNGHYLKGLLGYVQEMRTEHWLSGSKLGVYSNVVPTLHTSPGTPNADEGKSTLTTAGFFGRINYAFREKYLLEVNGRYDGSSRFLKENRFDFFAGVSAGWVVSNEAFWEPLKQYVNFFKPRFNYGSLGDQVSVSSGYYPFYPSMGIAGANNTNFLFSGGRENYVTMPGLVAGDLTWVSSTTIGVGVDLAFLDNRLNATFDWFQRSSDNSIGRGVTLPAVLGTAAPNSNNTGMRTNGFELTLGWRDHIGDFTYGVRATLADSRSVITKYSNPTGTLSDYYVGKEVGEIWGWETEGFYTEVETDPNRNKYVYNGTWGPGDIKYRDLNGDGVIDDGKWTVDDPGDNVVIGNSLPRYTYGVTLEGAYKDFDLSVFIQGVGQRDWYPGVDDNYFWGIVGSGNVWQSSAFTAHRDRWTPDNTNGYFPKFYMSGQNRKNILPQTKYLQDASYLRLKNLQVGYTLPKQLMDKVGISKLRIYISGENLLTFTKLLDTIDPELVSGAGKTYPLQATWSIGLNLTF